MAIQLNINGKQQSVDVPPNMPLLWVLRDTLGMTGTKFGCGMALCGACTVHIDGEATRSCITPVSSVAGKKITTIEGLSPDRSHPVQRAWIEVDVPQCGYCQSGQIMSASSLLAKNAKPSDAEIDEAMKRKHLPLRHVPANSRSGASRRDIAAAGFAQARAPRRNLRRGRRDGRPARPRWRCGMSAGTMNLIGRRGFLKTGAAGAAGLVIGFYLPDAPRRVRGAGGHAHRREAQRMDDDLARRCREDHDRQVGNGAGHPDGAVHDRGRRTGLRLENDSHRICSRGQGIFQSGVWNAGHRRQFQRALLVGSDAQGRCGGARYAAAGRGSPVESGQIRLPHRKRNYLSRRQQAKA